MFFETGFSKVDLVTKAEVPGLLLPKKNREPMRNQPPTKTSRFSIVI
jgi:hypothetical protein